jgi:peptidoglycan LD-endopeptidase LytH
MKRIKRAFNYILLIALLVTIIGFLLPQTIHNPVVGAKPGDWNVKSFWYYPWGRSVVHKGVDIFAKKGTPVKAAVYGIVVAKGNNKIAGNYVVVMGPKWRYHYYAHLNSINVRRFEIVTGDDVIGTVGDTGNAQGKQPHLHYTIYTLFPYPWNYSTGPHGGRKMFFIDPTPYL